VNTVAKEFTDIIGNGSMKVLEERLGNMSDTQGAFERMETRLYRLLNAGGQRDYDGDIGSSSV
jgi:hypothetical protein